MEAESLFIRRCERIDLLCRSSDQIDLIDLSVPLYSVMCDQHALMDVVNHNKIKLRFEVGLNPPDPPGWPPPASWTFIHGLDPYSASTKQPSTFVNKDDFLGYPVAGIGELTLRVKHVIGYARNVEGGGHFDPRDLYGEYRILRLMGQSEFVAMLPLSLSHLRTIGRIAVRGLQPLVEDVRRRASI